MSSRSHVAGGALILALLVLSLHYLRTSTPNKLEQHHLPEHTVQAFPRKIWQTWQTWEHNPQDISEENQRLSKTWTDLNTEHRYELLTSDSAMTFVQDHFKDQPNIVRTFQRLDDPILRADLIRYLALLAEGGVYSDLDTDCTRPIRDWVPRELLNATNVVLGVEYDAQGQDQRADFEIPAELCQWTLMSKPGHPVFQRVVDRVVEKLEVLGAGHEKINAKTTNDVLECTGPRVFANAVVEALADQTGEQVTHQDFFKIDSPKLFGDVLILPISAFASGQDHSASKPWGNDEQLISHHWNGFQGWKLDYQE